MQVADRLFHLIMDCSITAATVQDAELISSLITQLAEEFITMEFGEAGRIHFLSGLTPERMRERLIGDYRFFLAKRRSHLVGVSALRGRSHLYYLFVAKPYQGRGIARQLWLAAKAASAEAGHHGGMTVNSSTYAVRMYERFGFVRKGPPEESNGVLHHPMELIG